MISALAGLIGLLLLVAVLLDTFETIVLPRTVTRRFRLTRFFFVTFWKGWSATARRMRPGSFRETYLSAFGPLSMLLLLAVWAVALMVSFALLYWAAASAVREPGPWVSFGVGDVTPQSSLCRAVVAIESGIGLAFLAVVVGYLPVIYQSYSQREILITMLDARAGSPPSAVELLRRLGQTGNLHALEPFLREWEQWTSELLDSHLSYPVLSYYRSQHTAQSWLASLTTVMDICALILAGLDSLPTRQAQLTFAMGRHTVVDLALVYDTPPLWPTPDRLPPADLTRAREILAGVGLPPAPGDDLERKLTGLRRLYEPYVNALGRRFLLPLPPWIAAPHATDNWQTSAWESSHF